MFLDRLLRGSLGELLAPTIKPPSPQQRFIDAIERGDQTLAIRVIENIIRTTIGVGGEAEYKSGLTSPTARKVEGGGRSPNAGETLGWAFDVGLETADSNGLKPIHLAAKHGLKDVVETLVEKVHIDVDSKDDHGNTALHWAAKAGQMPILAWLLKRGANPEILNLDNQLPAAVASSPQIKDAILHRSTTIPTSSSSSSSTTSNTTALPTIATSTSSPPPQPSSTTIPSRSSSTTISPPLPSTTASSSVEKDLLAAPVKPTSSLSKITTSTTSNKRRSDVAEGEGDSMMQVVGSTTTSKEEVEEEARRLSTASTSSSSSNRTSNKETPSPHADSLLMPPPLPPSSSNKSTNEAIITPPAVVDTVPSSLFPPTPSTDDDAAASSLFAPTPPSTTTIITPPLATSTATAAAQPSYYQTPIKSSTTKSRSSASRRRYTVSPCRVARTPKTMEPKLGDAVLRAAVDTAACLTSPTTEWKKQKAVFDACALHRATPDHIKIQGLATKLQEKPSLAKARSTRLGMLVQDGQTPLHSAAQMGNMPAIEILLHLPNEHIDPFAVDLQGRTALHIAAQNGHLEVCRRLKAEMAKRSGGTNEPVGEYAPVDLAGRTPLGWRVSENKPAPKQLEEELFALGDPSIFPSVPLHGRTGGDRLGFGYCSTPGWQPKMEDTVCVHTPIHQEDDEEGVDGGSLLLDHEGNEGLFAVFDGHQGTTVATFAADNLLSTLLETDAWERASCGDTREETLAQALKEACLALDEKLASLPQFQMKEEVTMGVGREAGKVMNSKLVSEDLSGATAIISLVTPTLIATANLGDSRAILLSRASSLTSPTETPPLIAIPLSRDHKPDLPDEKLRVEAAGGVVKAKEIYADKDAKPEIIWRLYPKEGTEDSLAMTRALGDFMYKRKPDLDPEKQMVIAVPEVEIRRRTPEDEYLMLGCDGVWDVMSNEDMATFVQQHLEQHQGAASSTSNHTYLAELADDIVKESMKRGSRDNITALVVRLIPPYQGEGRVLFT